MIKSINLKAYAKINLGLDVIGKRPDGYHEVRMVMQTIKLHDKISINIINNPNIQIETNLHYLPTNENNIVYKAASLIREKNNITEGVHINIEKKIPVSAGLAGGSSDAAATLVGMNTLFDLGLSLEELMKLGVSLGADVPYCITGGTVLAEGIGEELTPLPPFPNCHILIVKPSINVSTKDVYGNLDLNTINDHPNIDGIVNGINKKDLYSSIDHFGNLLEYVTTNKYSEINQIKKSMIKHGALTSMMTGSGPTVFGIFDNKKTAEDAFYHFKVANFSHQVFLTRPKSSPLF